jgi:phage tail sheath gpL-like
VAVSFNFIPNLLLTPGAFIEIDSSRAVSGLSTLPNRVLLIGSRLVSGSVVAEQLVQVTRASDGIDFFGEGSQLARMVEVFKNTSKFTEVWAIALNDDGGAVAATKTITVTGTATSDGQLLIWLHGVRIPVAVASGDDPTTIAASIDAAIGAADNVMFTPGAVAGVVTLTCVHASAFGQDLDVRENYRSSPAERRVLPEGVSLAFANVVSGAGNPDIADAIAVVGPEYFTKWVSGYSDAVNVGAVEVELDDRWGPLVQQDGIQYIGISGTHSVLLAYGSVRNSEFTVAMSMGGVVNSSPTPEAEWAAAVAAVDSNEPDPARPRQTLPLTRVLAPEMEDLFTQSERNLLLDGGLATFTANNAGQVFIERLNTTYQQNAAALDDSTFMNLTTMHSLAAIRFTLRARIQGKYPRHKLVDNGTNFGAGQAVVTPDIIKAEILSLFGEWEELVWVEDLLQFSDELIVERNSGDRDRLDARLGPNLANQFRVFAAQIQFLL